MCTSSPPVVWDGVVPDPPIEEEPGGSSYYHRQLGCAWLVFVSWKGHLCCTAAGRPAISVSRLNTAHGVAIRSRHHAAFSSRAAVFE